MARLKNRIGEKFTTNEGYIVEITEYLDCNKCTIKFEDGFFLNNIEYSKIKKGQIKNPYHKSVYGIGFKGIGVYISCINYKETLSNKTWRSMIERCYSEKSQIKHPTYEKCTVHSDWHNFQIFADWFDKNHIKGWHLDKDVLIKGNTLYSEKTCCYIPHQINCLFKKRNQKDGIPMGVTKYKGKYRAFLSKENFLNYLGTFDSQEVAFYNYKKEKENYIKEIAEKWKGIIAENVYQAMINYEVEITD